MGLSDWGVNDKKGLRGSLVRGSGSPEILSLAIDALHQPAGALAIDALYRSAEALFLPEVS